MKNEEAVVEKQLPGDPQPKKFRLREATFPEVEDALPIWLRDARSQGIPVNGWLLQKREEQFAAILGHDDFLHSDSWLSRSKARYEATFKSIYGESDGVDDGVVPNWKNQSLLGLLASYEPRSIFNVNENELYYEMRPAKTYSLPGEPCHGGKRSKERTKETRLVSHLQFTSWPDYGVPDSALAMLAFRGVVRDKQAQALASMEPKWEGHPLGPPIVVHCSAGIGRTGTFITLDICILQLEEEGRVDVRSTVERIRSQRAFSIQMPDQYVFCHLALLEFALLRGLLQDVALDGFEDDDDRGGSDSE
ncbi:tyrosine-protein phosphatase non-receptor type 9 [Ixodes scapularis]